MNRAAIIRLGVEAGMKPSEAQPAINAIGRTVPVEWLERFVALVEAETRRAADLANAPLRDACEWLETNRRVNAWQPGCGAGPWMFPFTDGPIENGMRYCPNCGNKLVAKTKFRTKPAPATTERGV